jgi:S-adenosylmethionine hydrolase
MPRASWARKSALPFVFVRTCEKGVRNYGPKTVGPQRTNPYNATSIFLSRWSRVLSGQIEGEIVSYSESGNLVSDIAHERLREVVRAAGVSIACDEHETIGIYPADHHEEPLTLMAILGKSGCLELTIVGESAKAMLGVRVGEKVVVKW